MKHRTSVLNIAILVLVFAVAGAAQSTEIDSRDLLAEAEQVLRDQKMFELFNNCRAVPVLAGLASEGDVDGLTKAAIHDLAELRLRSARLYGGTLPEVSPQKVGNGYLSISVDVVGSAFGSGVEFQRRAFINAGGGWVTTWKHGRIGTHDGDGDYILQSVGIAVDNFVLEYLRVNEEACGRPPD